MYRIKPGPIRLSMSDMDTSIEVGKQDPRLENFMKLFDCDIVNDVTFEVGNLESGIEYISGNRMMFAAHSQVFKQMLFGPMIDPNSRSRNIVLNDISANTFKIVKQYCYGKPTREILSPTEGIDFAEILYFSDKYLFTTLRNQCILKIMNGYMLRNSDYIYCAHEFFEILNKLHDYKLHHILVTIIFPNIDWFMLHERQKSLKEPCVSVLELIVANYQIAQLKPSLLQLVLFNFNASDRKPKLCQEWLWKFLVKYCKTYLSRKESKHSKNVVQIDVDDYENKHDCDVVGGHGHDNYNVKWQDIMVEYFKDYIIYEHMSCSFFFQNVLTANIHNNKEIASIIAYFNQRQGKKLSLHNGSNYILSQGTKRDCKDKDGKNSNQHKEAISKSARGLEVYNSCFVKTRDYIIGIDHYCHRLFCNSNDDAIYYAIEVLANVRYQIPESRLECIKIGMINQLKDIQVSYLKKLNNNGDLDMVEYSKILLTLDNILHVFTDIIYGCNDEILSNVINIITKRLTCSDDEVFFKACEYFKLMIDECMRTQNIFITGDKDNDDSHLCWYLPAKLNVDDARLIYFAIAHAVDLKCLVNMVVKLVDNDAIKNDNQCDFDVIHLFWVILYIIRFDANNLDSESCEKIDQLVFDLNIFGVFEKALNIIDTNDGYRNPILDAICMISKCILVNGSSHCMNVALNNNNNVFKILIGKLSYPTKMKQKNISIVSEKENKAKEGAADGQEISLHSKMDIIDCIASILTLNYDITWDQIKQCIDIDSNNEFKLISICVDLLSQVCNEIDGMKYCYKCDDSEKYYNCVILLVKFLDVTLKLDDEMETKKCQDIIRKANGFQIVQSCCICYCLCCYVFELFLFYFVE